MLCLRSGVVISVTELIGVDHAAAGTNERHRRAADRTHAAGARIDRECNRVARGTAGCRDVVSCTTNYRRSRSRRGVGNSLIGFADGKALLHLSRCVVVAVTELIGVDHARACSNEADGRTSDRTHAAGARIDRERHCISRYPTGRGDAVCRTAHHCGGGRRRGVSNRLATLADGEGLLHLRRRVEAGVTGLVRIDDAATGTDETHGRAADRAYRARRSVDRESYRQAGARRSGYIVSRAADDRCGWRAGGERNRLICLACASWKLERSDARLPVADVAVSLAVVILVGVPEGAVV